ncbi:MAG TPA: 1,4-alpha-glucan branching protein domain-containing protein [Candidatus Limnocylindria bacterium]|nr:1,4-alpha-glucan branching protein domain-containing protein [Candidatus Limnocylindria bacterium]
MHFVLTLHSHLPWVLHHGRWPHGSDWLCEAATDTYLPLLEALDRLEREGTPSPLTIGVTPVLANQLGHPDFDYELEAFVAQRLEACDEAEWTLEATGETHLLPLAHYWRARLERLGRVLERTDGGITGALARHARAGRIELISSAATHGFLPLLRRPESVRLQLRLGRREHRRIFGLDPAGCWLPECAYRAGLEQVVRDAGFDFFFADAHMALAGRSLGLYGEHFAGGVRSADDEPRDVVSLRSPYRVYALHPEVGAPVAVFVRDPTSSRQVWSRHQGYPGDAAYLEFHKIRWPGGLKLWRVTDPRVDLGAKQPYDPNVARARAYRHAADFAAVLRTVRDTAAPLGGELIATPFDTELFGHWWYEGVDFLGDLYRALDDQTAVRPATAREHLVGGGEREAIELAEGSWGANGDFSMWMNPETEWTWTRLWSLEERFWRTAARERGADGRRRPALVQAARELLLAQASDWQFVISTGAAGDYAERRFRGHCDALAALLDAIDGGDAEAAARLADDYAQLDDCFPDPWPAVVDALGG